MKTKEITLNQYILVCIRRDDVF